MRRPQDPFVLWFSVGAGLLLLVALGSYLFLRATMPEREEKFPEDSPGAVVRNYLLALRSGDYDEARKYHGATVTEDRFGKPPFARPSPEQERVRFRIREVEVGSERAKVEVRISRYYGGDPFGGGEHTQTYLVTLVREKGHWKITEPFPFIYF